MLFFLTVFGFVIAMWVGILFQINRYYWLALISYLCGVGYVAYMGSLMDLANSTGGV